MREELSGILDHVERIQSLDLDDVSPTTHVIERQNVMRDDEPRPGLSQEEALREAHAAGRPVVVRAADPEAITRALARPEVACVLVPPDRPDLLDLDFRRITYGP